MAFIQKSGVRKGEAEPKTPSTAISIGAVLVMASGQLTLATTGSVTLFMVSGKKVSSTDSDYASATTISGDKLIPDADFLADVGSATTATTGDIGKAVDLLDSTTINMTGTTYGQFTVKRVLTGGTQVIGHFNATYLTRSS